MWTLRVSKSAIGWKRPWFEADDQQPCLDHRPPPRPSSLPFASGRLFREGLFLPPYKDRIYVGMRSDRYGTMATVARSLWMLTERLAGVYEGIKVRILNIPHLRSLLVGLFARPSLPSAWLAELNVKLSSCQHRTCLAQTKGAFRDGRPLLFVRSMTALLLFRRRLCRGGLSCVHLLFF
jgi:hypothetical protein